MIEQNMYRPTYLDCHSTTPVDPRVVEVMIPFFTTHFGNPASTNHLYGWEAETAITQAREIVAAAIGATSGEIIFTSGATEANTLAIKGVAESYFDRGRHLITVQTEHRAVLDPFDYLQSLGFDLTLLSVQPDGFIDLDQFQQSLRSDTILVSVMAANNEIGVLQPIEVIGQICRDRHILFHTDAAQAIGKIPLHVEKMSIDLMSLTAHKVYGPKGIGALYIRKHTPRVKVAPQLHGGGHEHGMRSGTLYTPQIVGFAKAIQLALTEMDHETQRLTQLRENLWCTLSSLEGVFLNGHPSQRLPGNLNISVAGVDSEALLLGMQPIAAVSSGSACTSANANPSHVLKALGRSTPQALASIRFGLGRFTTAQEIDAVATETVAMIQSLRHGRKILF